MEQIRYLNKSNNANERQLVSNWWYEQMNHYGVSVIYYTNGYDINAHSFLYGEDPTATYLSAGNVIMLTDITNDSILLSKFGIMADCDMTAVIHISAYYNTFGPGTEPKAGDLIELKEYGGFGDRPNGRGAAIYEITERDDEYLPLTNKLMGHYVWYIKCKRWEYSSEPGVHQEAANLQLSDGGSYGASLPDGTPIDVQTPIPQTVNKNTQVDIDIAATDGEEIITISGDPIVTTEPKKYSNEIFDYGCLSSPYGNY